MFIPVATAVWLGGTASTMRLASEAKASPVVDLRLWDVVRVAPAVVRGFEAGDEGLELLAVGGPKPEGGDGVLDAERWPAESED